MERHLRILILEDMASDAELMIYELRQAGVAFSHRRVSDREHFHTALQEYEPDLILSDFHLPSFDGLEALSLAQATRPEIPFIFVSGAMGEEVAIDSLKRGATDYVLKDRLARLAPAVRRALREAEERQERRQAEMALRHSEQRYRILLKNIPAVVYKGYWDCSVDFVDEKVEELTGYPKKVFDSRELKWSDLLIPADREHFQEAFLCGLRGSRSYIREYRIRRKDGETIWIQDRGQILCTPDGRVDYISGVFFDVTARRQAEEALHAASAYARSLIEASPDPLVTISPAGKIMDVNEATEKITGVARHDLVGTDFSDYFTEPDKAREGYQLVFSQGMVRDYPLAIRHVSGQIIDVLYNATVYRNESGEVQGVFAAARDITARKQAEEALRESENRFASFMRYLPGFAVMRDVQGHYLFANEAWERMRRLQGQVWQGKSLAELWLPEAVDTFHDSDLLVLERGEPLQTIEEIPQDDGIHNWLVNKFPILDKDGKPILIGSVGIDITRRQRAEEALRESEQRLRFLTSQLLSAQERERKRISMELHDELGQSLAVLKLQIRAIERRLGEDQQDLKEFCRELLRYLDGVIDNVRRLSRDLSPAILEDLGLQSALKYLIDGVSKHYTVTHSFGVEKLDQLFPSDAQIIIYRIFQECLSNISKHAGASEVSIDIREENGHIAIVMEDNGSGFDLAQVSARGIESRGMGLAALDERCRMLGGSLQIRTEPGQGTRIMCVVPIGHLIESPAD
jgi:PAS domain S-box-containing protein